MKRLNRWKSMAASLLTVLLLFIAVDISVRAYREKQGGPPCFLLGLKPVLILSDSMEPTMPEGSIAIVRHQNGKDVKKGDIIFFETEILGGRSYVVHRIEDITEQGIITKGDNNRNTDPEYLNEENVWGKVIMIWNFLQ